MAMDLWAHRWNKIEESSQMRSENKPKKTRKINRKYEPDRLSLIRLADAYEKGVPRYIRILGEWLIETEKVMSKIWLEEEMAEKRIAIYARVSSDQQVDESTIDSQIAALRDRVAQDGQRLAEELVFIDEGYSGAHLIHRDWNNCGMLHP